LGITMKRILLSVLCSVVILIVWGFLIVGTSQDFAHEGPNSRFFAPIDWWAYKYQTVAWNHALSKMPFAAQIIFGFVALLGPFLLLFSAISYGVIWLASFNAQKRRRAAQQVIQADR
jgi:hypothetical protein